MQNSALNILFLPLSGQSPLGTVLFINAAPSPALRALTEPENLRAVQDFKPFADELERFGYTTLRSEALEAGHADSNKKADTAFILPSRNRERMEQEIMLALYHLAPGGALYIAADNREGAGSLPKTLARFGLTDIQSLSKHKARVAWGRKQKNAPETPGTAAPPGLRPVPEGDFLSLPGIFSWERVDAGSALLARHIPSDFRGNGADFGCGYGFLSRHVLRACPAVESLACADADWNALRACRANLSVWPDKARVLWADPVAEHPAELRNLDFIVMNPPFHEGGRADPSIGAGFIRAAHDALKKGGRVFLVANTRLPYESVLIDIFGGYETAAQENGFKILTSIRA